MNIEKQICTLEQAKKLKELGVAQSISFFCWYELHQHEPVILKSEDVIGDWHSDSYAAFTVAELGIMLGEYALTVHKPTIGRNEAMDRADDLIHMLEISELTVDGVNERLIL